jgi:hypothetical protein
LEEDPDLSNGRGLAKLRDDLFAVSCINGNILLLAWDSAKSQFEVVRRIGAVRCDGLAVDRKGAVWNRAGSWSWSDGPNAAMHPHIVPIEDAGQGVMLDDNNLAQPVIRQGRFALVAGRPSELCGFSRVTDPPSMKEPTGSAVYKDGKRLVLLSVEKTGKGHLFQIAPNADWASYIGPVSLKAASPIKEWTSLATLGPDTLLAGGDGHVVVLTRDGADWKEKSRWSSWGGGAGDHFGNWLYITADEQHLWVCDRERQRVLCFDVKQAATGGAPSASFGQVDSARSDFSGLTRPQVVTACRDRVVVYDSGNWRLMKLSLR